jgi:hypothetical protein
LPPAHINPHSYPYPLPPAHINPHSYPHPLPPQHQISELNMKINKRHNLDIIPEMEFNQNKNYSNKNIIDNLIINPHIFIFFIITLTLLIIMMILYEYGYIKNINFDKYTK